MASVSENELLVLKCIWTAGRALSVSEIIELMKELFEKECKHTTVCTFLTRLKKKKYVDYTANGKSYLYFPLVSESDYLKKEMSKFRHFWFNDSTSALVSAFCTDGQLDEKELLKIRNLVNNL